MDDLLNDFLCETAESLETVEPELVRFEARPDDRAVLANIFRLVHTIKGTCGFLGLPRLESLTHAGETLLGRFRDDGLPVSGEAVTLILRSVDRIKDILSHLELVGVEPPGSDGDLIVALEAMSQAPAPEPAALPEPAPQTQARAPAYAPAQQVQGDLPEVDLEIGPYDADLDRHLRPGEVSLAELEAAFQATEVEVAAPLAAAPAPEPEAPAAEASTVRVDVDVLETLMTSVSELVLTRNQLLQMVRALDDSDFKAPLQRLSVITGELQESVMKTRMQPIGAAWRKLPRLVRDTARELGKSIELVMEGEGTELDRQVLELIRDPLTHMVRNSADHGLESPEARRRAGKPETGTIRVSAAHEGGAVVIRVADDGRGLNTHRILEKALSKGVVSRTEAMGMTEAQVHRFIFAPGFSTAEAVTNLSGRGVGLDVVRSNIERIGGRIELSSTEGRGTTFTVKIPLTLAIISTLIVGAGGQRFAIPQLAVEELVRIGEGAPHRIERINASPVLRLRDHLVPLVNLTEHLRLQSEAEARFVVILKVAGRRFGVALDAVFDTEEIVVKPVAALLKDVAAYAGATILGDGSVVLILEPASLAEAAGQVGAEEHEPEPAAAPVDADGGVTPVLIVKAGDSGPKAVPLALVTRLEDIPVDTIERAGGRDVVQYRGRLMPLIHAAGQPLATEGKQPVLVFTDGDRLMGLAVDQIADIVEERLSVEAGARRPGIVGSAVLKGRATDVLDISHYLTEAFGDWFERDGAGEASALRRVLLVDDNAFFRNMMSPLLAAAGYDVTTAGSAEDAWRLHENGAEFDAIVSDIEMPDEDGYAFAARLRDGSRWAQAPRIALTGLPVDQAVKRAPAGAFAGVVRKSDRQGLIDVLSETFSPGRAA